MITLVFENFTARLIRYVLSGHLLDDTSLMRLRDDCIRDLKNSTMTGMSLEEEAEVFRQAVENATKLLDAAITRGREF
jgi:hypothetical protein